MITYIMSSILTTDYKPGLPHFFFNFTITFAKLFTFAELLFNYSILFASKLIRFPTKRPANRQAGLSNRSLYPGI